MKQILLAAFIAAPFAASAQIVPLRLSTPVSGSTSATPGTWTSALASSNYRNGCTIQNSGSATINIALGPNTPSAAQFTLQPQQAFNCVDQQQVWVMSATASVSYQGASW